MAAADHKTPSVRMSGLALLRELQVGFARQTWKLNPLMIFRPALGALSEVSYG